MTVSFLLNGKDFTTAGVDDEGNKLSLMDVLRDERLASVKDGCAPQGQCGCCTVVVDGKARVSCVTPVSRVRGRSVETLEGLSADALSAWSEAFAACGATQCGFCTPGIVMRFEARHRDPGSPISRAPITDEGDPSPGSVDLVERVVADAESALKAHLCRCTGWNGIVESAVRLSTGRSSVPRLPVDPVAPAPSTTPGNSSSGTAGPIRAADRRATLESGTQQSWVPSVPLGFGRFAIDTVPHGSLVAMRDAGASWVVGESLQEARRRSGKVQGRRTTSTTGPPVEMPSGNWDATLQTSWVEPGYLETDSAWCEPGGEPSPVLANGGAFGAKLDSPLPEEARRLAEEAGWPVLAIWSREDSIRLGSKRPPLAIGMRSDGSGAARVASGLDNDTMREAMLAAAPGLALEFVEVPGPPVSSGHRCAGWLEALAASVAAGALSPMGGRDGDWFKAAQPGGGWAKARIGAGASSSGSPTSGTLSSESTSLESASGSGPPNRGRIEVVAGAGEPLSEVVLRSYATGAAHMALGLVGRESITVEPDGEVKDLTIRSLGILGAHEMPPVLVEVEPDPQGDSLPVADAVFAAVACAVWSHHDWAPIWPTLRKPLL